MMRKFLFVILVLLLVAPAINSFSATFNRASLWSENRYYDDIDTYEYGMLADTGISTNAYDVFMYVPSWTGDEYHQLELYSWFGGYGAGKFLTTTDGYPAPGSAYETIDIIFFIDEDDSGSFDAINDTYVSRNYSSGTFSQLPFVTNVKISNSGSDVIVSWDGIAIGGEYGDDENDQYRVRVIDKATNDFYFDSGKININTLTNKYAYNLGDLSAYGDDLWIAIETREGTETIGLANRSRYYASVSSVPNECKGDLDNDGVVDGTDLFIFSNDYGRTDCP
jgi:hypothetical protein